MGETVWSNCILLSIYVDNPEAREMDGMDKNSNESITRKSTFADKLQKEMEQRKTTESGLAAIISKFVPFMASGK
jgi:hypothetical protein